MFSSSSSDWANLPEHLLDSISMKIGSVSRSDYVRFSLVCMSWYSVAKHNVRQLNEISASHHPPMLFIPTPQKRTWHLFDATIPQVACSVYNSMDNKFLDFLHLELPNKRLCGSSKGWLIVMDLNLVLTLINPFTTSSGVNNSIIHLPPLDPYKSSPHYQPGYGGDWLIPEFVTKATISADPIVNADDCTVVVIHEDSGRVAYIRLNKDTTWTYVGLTWIEDVVVVKDQCYAVKADGRLFSFHLTTHSTSFKQLVASGIERDELRKTYLVVLHDQRLWMIQRFIKFELPIQIRETTKVRIFEFNFDKYEWIEKNTLGDVALFLGGNFSISVMASNFPGCHPNSIYFNFDLDRYVSYAEDRPRRDYGVYDVESRSFSQPYTADANALLAKTMQSPFWVVPTIQL